MSFFTKVSNFLTGGIGGKIVDKVLSQFPDKLSEEQKSAITQAATQATREYEKELLELAHQQDVEFNQRIKDLEGTAQDLKHFGWIGSIVVFLRGCQRPTWGYLTLYMDMKWFSGQWAGLSQQQESALWIVNILVLSFLFGERAIKNAMPFITEFFKQKGAK